MIVSPGRPVLRTEITPSDRVLVLGGYGIGNSGDEAVLAGLLRKIGEPGRVSVISRDPESTRTMHGVRGVGVKVAASELGRCDVLVIGGGGLFSSHMGTLGRAIPFFGLMALAAGKRVVIDGVSVDATTPRTVKSGLVQLARHATSVTVRDSASAALLRSWGAGCAEVGPDLSEFLSPAPGVEAQAVLESSGLNLGRPIVALCLTAVDPRYDDFLQFDVPGMVRRLRDVQFCVVPMSRHPGARRHDDRRLARWLQRRLPRLAVIDAECHPAVTLSMFEMFSAAVCMRYHSFLFAERAGTPVVGIPYAAKCRRWMEEHQVAEVPPGSDALARAVNAALVHGPGRPECLD